MGSYRWLVPIRFFAHQLQYTRQSVGIIFIFLANRIIFRPLKQLQSKFDWVLPCGFGNFVQAFQVPGKKEKYGVPIYLPNGNINPAYLAAERAEMAKTKANNRKTLTARRKQMESKGTFLLDSYIEKKIGNVGSGKAYYQSGK